MDMDEKLKLRVCRLAGAQMDNLTRDAAAFLRRRTKKWLSTRELKESDMQKAAADLKRRYPLSFSSSATPAPQQQTKNVVSSGGGIGKPQPIEAPRSKTTEPSVTLSRGVSPVTLTAGTPIRRCVLKRLKAISADAEFQAILQKDAEKKAEAEQKELEQRREKLRVVREDMQRVEAERQQRLEESRRERQENRKMVINAAAQVKLDEQEDKERRKARFMEEKKFIEDQREARRIAREHENTMKVMENVKQREALKQSIDDYERQEHKKAVAVRDSLLQFLDQSKTLMEQRNKIIADQKREERERDKQLLKEEAFEAYTKRDAKVRSEQLGKVAQRNRMQEMVGATYTQIMQENEKKRLEEEARLRVSVQKKYEEDERRERAQNEKRAALKAQLVSSLDEEIARKEERKRQLEIENSASRLAADLETEKFRQEQLREKSLRRERQQKLRADIDAQEAAKLEQIFNSMPPSFAASPALMMRRR